MKNSMQDEIVRLLPSEELREAISERQTVFSDAELLKIASEYAPDYETRLAFCEKLRGSFSGQLREYADALIKNEKVQLARFSMPDENAVYELHVKDTYDSFEERYLCASLEAALRTIPRYYEEYAEVGAKASSETVYRIVKRSILTGREEKFNEDYLGDATYFAGPVLYSVDTKEKDARCGEGRCFDCGKLCLDQIDVSYPRILCAGDVVKYGGTLGMPEKIGFIPGFNGEEQETIVNYYVIPLDCEDMRLHRFSPDYWDHDHVLPPLLHKIPIESLDEKMRGDLEAYLEYQKTLN